MKNVFDNPTRFTLNALYVKPATKADLTAIVEFREGFGSVPAWRYLGPQVAGGFRSTKSGEHRLIEAGLMKSSEVIVPGQGVKRDAYGNVPSSTMNRILSDLGARADTAQNTTTKSRKRNAGRNRGRYFVLRPGGVPGWPRSDRDVHPGIYHRAAGSTGIVPVLMFVQQPRYQRRDGATVFLHACKLGLEGIVSKMMGHGYQSGRSTHWIKSKNPASAAARREAEEDWITR